MAEKIIRDPVHDVIAFSLDRPTDALLFQLLNAAEFQRLRRIRQLGMANMAYPGADHSRYSHSVGVMETARKILHQLTRSFTISEQDITACLAAALLHDLGHGPFSHVFERVSGVDHEDLTRLVILDSSTEVNQILSRHDSTLPQLVVNLLNGDCPRKFLCDILSSQLDADRLDYLLRDNLMTGSQYGNYDLSWLLHALTIDEPTQRLAVTWKGVSAVEAYLQSRYHMYRNVYFHKVVRSGEGMLRLALQRAKRLAVQGRLTWPREENPVYQSLMGLKLDVAEFADLDDVSVLHCFKLWTDSEDPVLANLCRGLLHRRLFKTIDLQRFSDKSQIDQILAQISDAMISADAEPAYEMFYDEPTDLPYQVSGLFVKDNHGKLREFSTLSPMVESLGGQLFFKRLHVAAQWRELAQKVVNATVI
ncbi:MAG TPA: HD domain-containing protein [Tepidisphaeraceae bacterium]|nr:HD domain-containing protein [Tepidisphaeraceae bacterium]